MTQLADSKLAALQTLTGATGTVQDLEAAYLVLLGATVSRTIVDQWGEVFDNAAIAAGQHNDRWMAYMDSILAPATEGHYNDREREYWDGGGTPLGPVIPQPPLTNLLHWFDLTDPSQVFQDSAGLIPAVDGSLIQRINNKGSDGQPMDNDIGGIPTYKFAGVNGLNVSRNIATPEFLRTTITNTHDAGGLSWFGALKSDGAPNFLSPFLWATFSDTTKDFRISMLGFGDWLTRTGLNDQDTLKPVIANEWVWVYGSQDSGGVWEAQAAGQALQSASQAYGALDAGSVIQLCGIFGDCAEILVYEGTPSSVTRDAVIAYFDAKYGVMPFLVPPATVVNLIHHYDFADPATVFRNLPGTQLAGDGDVIRRVTDKGSSATDLTTASTDTSPEYRTGVLQGKNIADFFPSAFSKPMTGTDAIGQLGVKGMSNAIVFKIRDPLGAAVQLADWGSLVGRLRILRDFGAGFMLYDYPGPIGAFSTGVIIPDAWYLWYASFTGAAVPSDDRVRLSGEVQQILSGVTPSDILPGEIIALEHISTQDIQVAEWGVWDGPLTDPELALLEDYVLAKYGVLPALPLPAPGNLLHHVDATDESTVWQDAAGTIPATEGLDVGRIDNKGTRGTPFLKVGLGGTLYKTGGGAGIINGLNVIEFASSSGQLTIGAESPGLAISTTGMTMAMVTRRRAAAPVGNDILWRWTPFAGSPGPGLRLEGGTEGFISQITGIADEDLSVQPAVLDTWYLIYISLEAAGSTDDAKFGSPGPEVAGPFGDPTDIPDLADFRFGTSLHTVEHAEAWFWDRPLTSTERADLVAHVNAKYGALPHL